MGDLRRVRSSLVWLVLIVAVVALWFIVVNNDNSAQTKPFGEVVTEIKAGEVLRLTQTQNSDTVRVDYIDEDQRQAKTILPPESNLVDVLDSYGVDPN